MVICQNETLPLNKALVEQERPRRHEEPRHVESHQESANQVTK